MTTAGTIGSITGILLAIALLVTALAIVTAISEWRE